MVNSNFGKKKKRKVVRRRPRKKCERGSGLTRAQHARLMVRKSTIPKAGKGLFARKDIPKGTKLGYYAGVYLTEEQYNKLRNQDYVWYVKENLYVDAYPCKKALLRFINSFQSSKQRRKMKKQFNVEPYTYGGKLWYRTIKNVKAGEELFIDYGDDYWD